MKKINLAIVGATGLVGLAIVRVLEERNFLIDNLYLFASAKSVGTQIAFNNKMHTVEELTESSFNNKIDIAIFSAGAEISRIYAPIAKSKGVIVIDNSSAWRLDKTVPLVVPEVNPEDVALNSGIIANPNCSTIQAVVMLKPLHDKYKIKRIVYSTYQSVSGAGTFALQDLKNNTNNAFEHKITNNLIPKIDEMTLNGYTKEEMKLINETHKILHDGSIFITATCVRVPISCCHSESINIEFETEFDLTEIINLLEQSSGIVVQNDTLNNQYPMPISSSNKDSVFVGRIRRDYSVDNGINIFVVADNIRKGAATNAVQIALLVAQTL